MKSPKEIKKFLKRVSAPYANGSPFAAMREDEIAKKLEAGQLVVCYRPHTNEEPEISEVWDVRRLSQRLTLTDFAQRKVSFREGTIFIKTVAFELIDKATLLCRLQDIQRKFNETQIAIELYAEDKALVSMLEERGLHIVMTKVSAYAEIKVVMANYEPREAQWMGSVYLDQQWDDPVEDASLTLCKREACGQTGRAVILDELEKFLATVPKGFAPHYSIYNKDDAWSGIALRGYAPDDFRFIEKPTEMSKQWKKENAHLLDARCDYTEISAQFLTTLRLARLTFPGCDLERVRILKLSKGNIYRHCDIQDKEAGTANGMISRFHIPLVTNDRVTFHSWNCRGEEETLQMRERDLYYLDHRKPHAVTNESDEERLHLVIDVYANSYTRDLIAGKLLEKNNE